MNGLYAQYIDVTDFGPYVTKLILSFPEAMEEADLQAEDFHVHVVIRKTTGEVVKLPKSFLERDKLVPSEGDRMVLKAYPSDLKGNAVTGKSPFVTLELAYGPIYPCSSALAADFQNINGHESYTVSDYTITWKPEKLCFDTCRAVYNPKRERFQESISPYEPLPLRYGYFVPDLHGGKKALIVWLHGAGEGGQDTAISYSGNKVTELTEPWVQEKFHGAFILSPQCPTMWLDDGSGAYGDSGKSMYGKALKACIDAFIMRFADVIDTDRIYVGGDSNGGFMTMRMILDYPTFFAAAFPICEAMLDARITEKELQGIAHFPIWFTHGVHDPVVVPEKYVLPTIERLKEAGNTNVHLTLWEEIVDIHTGFQDAEGKPYKYFDHFAWIPMLNDDCRLDADGQPVQFEGEEVTLMDWLARQKR